MNKNSKAILKVSSLYMATAYLTGIIIYVVILKYPYIDSSLEKLKVIFDMKGIYFLTNTIMYVLFGPALILFILTLNLRLVNKPLLLKFSSITGYIWAGSLVASGMISNGAILPIAKLYNSNPELATRLWEVIDTIAQGIGNGYGEILGGIMTLGISIVIGKKLGTYGTIVGIIGIATIVPVLTDLTALFGILQLVWFILVGFSSSCQQPSQYSSH